MVQVSEPAYPRMHTESEWATVLTFVFVRGGGEVLVGDSGRGLER